MRFLKDFFEHLEDAGIVNIVLRNYQNLPESIGESDLDILIEKRNAAQFFTILKDVSQLHNGHIVSFIESETPRICVLGYSDKSWGIMIDVHYETIQYRNCSILSKAQIWKYSFNYRPSIVALDPRADALVGLLKELLNNKHCSEKYYSKFKSHALDFQFLKEIFGENGKPEVADLLMELKDKDYSKSVINDLSRELNNYYPESIFSNNLKVSKYRRLFRQPGHTLAVLGTDGSGKSTLINELIKPLNATFHKQVYYEHLRPNYLPSLADLFGKKNAVEHTKNNPHANKSSGFLVSLVRWFYYLGDYTIGYWVKIFKSKATRSCIWIYDRYYYDYLIDPKRTRVKLPKWFLNFGLLMIPEPDIILCLGTDPKTMYERKKEISLEEVTRQYEELKLFCAKRDNAVWIDTGTSLEKSVNKSIEAIAYKMNQRFSDCKLT